MKSIVTILVVLVVVSRVASNESTWTNYHTNREMETELLAIARSHPDIAQVMRIGVSASGAPITAIRITSPHDPVAYKKPSVKFVATVHGDETLGREMLLRLASELSSNYEHSTMVRHIVDSLVVYIVPNANPDGYGRNARSNTRGIDLNRDFPDHFISTRRAALQPETTAIVNLSTIATLPVLCMSFHGGALVANYPWDGYADPRTRHGTYSRAPDDRTLATVALTYARNHATMWQSREFRDGITNGAKWYPLYGGIQDWEYVTNNCVSITVEMSMEKHPPASELDMEWQRNSVAIATVLDLAASRGIRGRVTDSHDVPIPGTTVVIKQTNVTVSVDAKTGSFARIVLPGTHDIVASAPGFITSTWHVVIKEPQLEVEVHAYTLQRRRSW